MEDNRATENLFTCIERELPSAAWLLHGTGLTAGSLLTVVPSAYVRQERHAPIIEAAVRSCVGVTEAHYAFEHTVTCESGVGNRVIVSGLQIVDIVRVDKGSHVRESYVGPRSC
jgi:hypothetical protein